MIEKTDDGLRVAVPRHLLSSPTADHFVLRVVGDAMREDGICDGDFLVVLRRHSVEPGEMAIVQIGDESTIGSARRSGPREIPATEPVTGDRP